MIDVTQRGNERGAETRASLMAAGRSLFAQKGFDGASVRDITRQAGTNLGSVTYHFGSKRALYGAVLESFLTPLVDRVGEAASDDTAPLDRVDAVVDAFLEHVAANPDLPRLMMQELTAGKTPPPEVVAIVRRNLGHLTGILSDGWSDGSIRQGHPVLQALSVVSQPIYMSLVSPLLREVGGIDMAQADFRTEVAAHIKAFLRAGLGSREELDS